MPAWIETHEDAEFRSKLLEAVNRLRASKTGTLLLDKMKATEKTVEIRPWNLPSGNVSSVGGRVMLWWNPDFSVPRSPAFVMLHHELVHALQSARGPAKDGSRIEDEAIGLGQFINDELSENRLRRELGLPHRPSHAVLPGFSDEELSKRFLDTFEDKDFVRKRMGPRQDHPDSLFRKIDVTIPKWVEEQEKE
ncbi:MAG: hypothetical protein HYZ75_07795 [Elusimicrobia bacterium]|nr:hypothetical protein [Elusimicrobiota bacterium]